MKLLKHIFFSSTLLLIFVLVFSCSSSKYALQKKAPLLWSHAYSFDWTTGIDIGSSGTDLFLANLTPNQNVQIDSVFFKKMKGKLVKEKGMYSAQLIKRRPISKGHTLTTTGQFHFKLLNSECVVSYIEGGLTKYFKIVNVQEKEGVHYPSGPPNKQ